MPLILFYCIAAFTVYNQHQIEDTYWNPEKNSDYYDSCFFGASFVDPPNWYKWLTGYIVYHNIHHLMPTIPNYNLDIARLDLEKVYPFKTYSLKQAYNMLNCKIWDEEKRRLVPFEQALN